jgi:hypothetical protein
MVAHAGSQRHFSKGLVVAILASFLVFVFPIGADKAIASDPSRIVFNNDSCELTAAGYTGDGSEVDPYVISDADSLQEIADCSLMTADTLAHFSISSDINVTQAVLATSTIPIGSRAGSPIAFKGVLRGNGYLISGISMSHATDGVGLFEYLSNSTIDNFRISGSFAGGTGANDPYGATGALARAARGNVVINSVTIDGSMSGESFIGGLIGYSEIRSSKDIRSSTNYSSVAASRQIAGGLIGYVEGSATVTSSDNSGSVSTSSFGAGGLVGMGVDAKITSS